MTTLTRIADDGQAVIEVDPEKVLSRIDPMIYGGFTE
jgi:alpha-N-arabinofuranosidase